MPFFQNEIRIVSGPNEIPEHAVLWRYMRLSTLLMMLRGKVFVPTITELRRGDPIEARELTTDTRAYFDDLPVQDREWLLGRANEKERNILNQPDIDRSQRASVFVRIWDRELAERRRIWCWHHADIESMALWQIYAKEGVAVSTTPARIKDSFDPHFVGTALIARVHYIDRTCHEAPDHCYMRPYLLKQRCYEHEREMRVVFPRDSDDPDGRRLLPLDPRKLINEVRISPHTPRSEALEIRRSLIQAWRYANQWDERDDDPAVFPSDTTTVFESNSDRLALNQCESTGITNFGSLNMPFVMCGDFSYCSNPRSP